MAVTWHKLVARFYCGVYFRRVVVVHHERIPTDRPLCFLGLHRNGAVDALVYNLVLPNIVFMISTQLRSNWFVRLFFHGIEVARRKDDGSPSDKRAVNAAALDHCAELLRGGGELFIFPEGTSTLGPSHLPFKNGAARLLARFIGDGGSVELIPLAITYDSPWTFRSSVEVVVGEGIPTDFSATSEPDRRVDLMHGRIQEALERVGTNFASVEQHITAQRLARMLTLDTRRSYDKGLKSLERDVPSELARRWKQLSEASEGRNLLTYHDVPLFCNSSLVLDMMRIAILGPVVLTAGILNAPPLISGQQAGLRCADDRNVISLWRILVGVPALVVWAILLAALAIATGKFAWFALYAVVTWLGLLSYDHVKRDVVAVYNSVVHRALASRWRMFRCEVQQKLQMRGVRDDISTQVR